VRTGRAERAEVPQSDLVCALGSVCALHRVPFSGALVEREFPPPCTQSTLTAAGRASGMRIRQIRIKPHRIEGMTFPMLVGVRDQTDVHDGTPRLGLVTASARGKVVLLPSGTNTPRTLSQEEFKKFIFLSVHK
jgi:ATP-binding cassette, subfamily B, bacterial HlyB/CyaB